MAESQALMKEVSVREVEESLVSRIEEMESRMQVLEEAVAKQNDKIVKNIADMVEAIRFLSVNRGVASTSEDPNTKKTSPVTSSPPIISSDSVRGQLGMQNSYSRVTWLANLEFPRFNGDKNKIWEWLYKVELIFEIDHTPEGLKVSLAAYHLDKVAATWYQTLTQSDLGKSIKQDWSTFKMLLLERFENLLDDPMEELRRLQETDGIMEYHERFESIITRMNLPKKYLVSMYLAGLRMDTRMQIRMFQPKSIIECLRLGRLYEEAHPREINQEGHT